MSKKEFENWYKLKKNWLNYKARYLLSTIGWSYNDVDELISLTIEKMLEDLNKIKLETVDSYCFFKMKNAMHNKLTYHTRKVCCEGDFTEYNVANKEYDYENDKLVEKNLSILEDRVETETDFKILDALLKGKHVTKLGIPLRTVTKITNKIKGLSTIRKKYKKISTGNPKGRPKLNKIKEKKMKIYKGVAQLNDKEELIKVFASANDVVFDGFSRESVSKCCNGKLKLHKGFKFKFVKDLNEKNKNNKLV